jgi:hypothetical protein
MLPPEPPALAPATDVVVPPVAPPPSLPTVLPAVPTDVEPALEFEPPEADFSTQTSVPSLRVLNSHFDSLAGGLADEQLASATTPDTVAPNTRVRR